MKPATLSVAGVVVDDAGALLANRHVGVGFPALWVTTDADGRFESYAQCTDAVRVHVPAILPDYCEANVEMLCGTFDARVVMRRLANVEGYLRVDDGHASEGLTIFLLRVDETSDLDSAPGTSRFCACDGKFEFPNVLAGKYVLQVKARDASGTQKVVYSRWNVVVPGGQTTDLGEIVIR